jgi:hypothetical protein
VAQVWDAGQAKPHLEHNPLSPLGVCHAIPIRKLNGPAVWAECWNRIQEYLQELAIYHADKTNVIARDRSKQALKRVRELMHEKRELSAVARACVLSSGDPRVTGILQSA